MSPVLRGLKPRMTVLGRPADRETENSLAKATSDLRERRTEYSENSFTAKSDS
jgi:hypothetical protein